MCFGRQVQEKKRRPQALYWWEANIGIPRTPTPIGGIPTEEEDED